MQSANNRKLTQKLSSKPVRFSLNIALLMIPLASCQTVNSSGCPPLVTYPAAFQRQAAQELRAAGGNVQVLVTDYGKLRDACRTMK